MSDIPTDSLGTPFVIRPVKAFQGESGFAVIGPCYVHVIMYGETGLGDFKGKEEDLIPLV
jgi:hypothetical protein